MIAFVLKICSKAQNILSNMKNISITKLNILSGYKTQFTKWCWNHWMSYDIKFKFWRDDRSIKLLFKFWSNCCCIIITRLYWILTSLIIEIDLFWFRFSLSCISSIPWTSFVSLHNFSNYLSCWIEIYGDLYLSFQKILFIWILLTNL